MTSRNIAVTQDANNRIWYMEWPSHWPVPDNYLEVQVEYVRHQSGVDTRMIRNTLINFYKRSDVIATNAEVIEAYDLLGGPRYSQRVPDPLAGLPLNPAPTSQEIAEAAPALMVERTVVVVKVPSSGFVAATVIKELDYFSEQSTKYVVQVVDTGKYEQRAEKAKLREEILKQLREAAKKSDEIVKFQLLAAQDPKIAALLDQLQRV